LLGVDIDNLLISQPDTGEQALEITDALVRSGAVGVIVVDSVAALVPKLKSRVILVIHKWVFRPA
jgi:recombination protein RecA